MSHQLLNSNSKGSNVRFFLSWRLKLSMSPCKMHGIFNKVLLFYIKTLFLLYRHSFPETFIQASTCHLHFLQLNQHNLNTYILQFLTSLNDYVFIYSYFSIQFNRKQKPSYKHNNSSCCYSLHMNINVAYLHVECSLPMLYEHSSVYGTHMQQLANSLQTMF